MAASRTQFWQKHPGLVWSNPDAADSVYIRAALLRPRFGRLLEIALEFGFERVRAEWAELLDDPHSETNRARDSVERILNNIRKGFALAAERN